MSFLICVLAVALVVSGCAARSPAPPPRPAANSGAGHEPAGDPTRGQFINATSWSLRVWIDPERVNAERPPTVVIQPGDVLPWTLSRGQHRIVVQAHGAGQAAGPAVARFDRTIALDPARPDGWYLRFREADFR